MDNDLPIIGSSVEDIPDDTQGDSFKYPGMLEYKIFEIFICCAFSIPEPLKFAETDSESIETISDDECFISHPLASASHSNIASFCYIPGGLLKDS